MSGVGLNNRTTWHSPKPLVAFYSAAWKLALETLISNLKIELEQFRPKQFDVCACHRTFAPTGSSPEPGLQQLKRFNFNFHYFDYYEKIKKILELL